MSVMLVTIESLYDFALRDFEQRKHGDVADTILESRKQISEFDVALKHGEPRSSSDLQD